jgi:AraC-like DNA-binding protein
MGNAERQPAVALVTPLPIRVYPCPSVVKISPPDFPAVNPDKAGRKKLELRAEESFREAAAWRGVGAGYRELGFSFEWHDFTSPKPLDWAASFHPGSLELCLNLEGTGRIQCGERVTELPPRSFSFYFQGEPPLLASRRAGEAHRFITVEFAPVFLRRHFAEQEAMLHENVRAVARGEARGAFVQMPGRLTTSLVQIVDSLRHCPVFTPAQGLWFRCKAIEAAAHVFFRPPDGDFFCTRAQRASRERVEKAREIIRQRLAEMPSLEELARLVGCSPFYLSRQFSQETGMTIQKFVRLVRMERAAELLRTGQCNVTEAALEVGYNSLSHFSSVFHETFGCCPGLFPLKTPAQSGAQTAEFARS